MKQGPCGVGRGWAGSVFCVPYSTRKRGLELHDLIPCDVFASIKRATLSDSSNNNTNLRGLWSGVVAANPGYQSAPSQHPLQHHPSTHFMPDRSDQAFCRQPGGGNWWKPRSYSGGSNDRKWEPEEGGSCQGYGQFEVEPQMKLEFPERWCYFAFNISQTQSCVVRPVGTAPVISWMVPSLTASFILHLLQLVLAAKLVQLAAMWGG